MRTEAEIKQAISTLFDRAVKAEETARSMNHPPGKCHYRIAEHWLNMAQKCDTLVRQGKIIAADFELINFGFRP